MVDDTLAKNRLREKRMADIQGTEQVKLEAGRLKGTAKTAPALIGLIQEAAKLMGYPVRVTIDEIGSTLDYKALVHIWFKSMAEQFSARDKIRDYTVDDIHDLMCHKFFGYTEPRIIGKTRIEPALITITYPRQKTRPELYHFCRQIEEWCSEVGVTLPEKPTQDSQYAQDKCKENA